MISAIGLTKRFGSFSAIEDLSFEVRAGEIVGLLGPNGAGKTTTMRILAGVFPPTSGRALVAGHDVVRDSLRARSAIGYFPERVALPGDLTVVEYLNYVANLKRVPGSRLRDGVRAALAATGLEAVSQRIIASLSKGFRQRVGIAQALVGEPQVLILDEPTSGLDPRQVTEMRSLIRSLAGQRTVMLSTHVLSEVEAVCERVIILNRGRVVAEDTPENLDRRLRRGARIFVEAVGPDGPIASCLAGVDGVLSIERREAPAGLCRLVVHNDGREGVREAVAAAVLSGGWGLRELRPVASSLEEIFLTLVDGGEQTPSGAEEEKTAAA